MKTDYKNKMMMSDIGFIPIKSHRDKRGILVHTKAKLVEISTRFSVPIESIKGMKEKIEKARIKNK